MAITSSSGLQSPSGGIWSQIQQQQAQRNADQAEQQARALQSRAREAQTVADRAQENARSLKVQSGQAQGQAESARRGLVAMESIGKVQTGINDLREQISAALAPAETAVATTAEPAAVINVFGQATGTLVNVTA
ncbi:hypothetical protein [Dechloromonas sp. A34]|uniref:hypothetical protein n=1 Tax=Dechloromonas sp. A34 TaxID=447588 RepID=UPI002248844E|nr:hypothetical protein [Dechloromonas sp. A34]